MNLLECFIISPLPIILMRTLFSDWIFGADYEIDIIF